MFSLYNKSRSLLLIAASFLASGLNNLIATVFPLFVRGKVNSGMIAGVLNGFCYLESTLSAYGLGSIADRCGWSAFFWALIGFCMVVCLIWGGYKCMKRFTKVNVK